MKRSFWCLVGTALALLLGPVPVPSAAQSDTQTHITPDGVQIDYPAGWPAVAVASGLDMASNAATLDAAAPSAGGVLVIVRYATPSAFADQFGATIATAADLFALVTATDAVIFSRDTVERGGHDYLRATLATTGETATVYVGTLDPYLVWVAAYAQNNDALRSQRAMIDSVVASIRMATDSPPDTPTNDAATDGNSRPQPATSAAADPPYIWLRNYERTFGLNAVSGFEGVVFSQGVLLLYDGAGELIEIDLATGAILSFAHNDDLLSFHHPIAAPDGTLWGFGAFDGLIHVQRDLTRIRTSGPEVLEGGSVQSMAIGNDGLLYVVVAGDLDAILVFDASATPIRRLPLPREFDNAYGLHILARTDGTFLLLDADMDNATIDARGNEVADEIRFRGAGNVYAIAFAMGSDGAIYALTTFDGLHHFNADGRLVASFGTTQDDNTAPFAVGELPALTAQIVVVPPAGQVIVGANVNYVTVMHLSMATLDE